MTRLLAAIVVLAVIAVVTTVGHAEPEARRMTAAAQPYFERGSQAYAGGAYDDAIIAFEAGQRLDDHPDFLYALAQAYRKQGDCGRATELYRAFLATRPPEKEATMAGLNLARCPTDLEVRPWYTDATGDVLAGAALIGLGIGTGYLIAGERDITAGNRAAAGGGASQVGQGRGALAEYQRLTTDGVHERRVGTWIVAGGSALAVVAVARYVLHRPGRAVSHGIAIAPRSGGGIVSWGARF
jgi:hypothetical protein